MDLQKILRIGPEPVVHGQPHPVEAPVSNPTEVVFQKHPVVPVGKYFIQSGSVEKYSRRLNPYHFGLMGEDAAAAGSWLAADRTVGSIKAGGSAATNAEEPRYFSTLRRFTRGILRSALDERG